jgi:hypothetical protein
MKAIGFHVLISILPPYLYLFGFLRQSFYVAQAGLKLNPPASASQVL